MDNITQGVIGGAIYTLITKKQNNKNFRLGAGIANIPDLDVIVGRLLPLSPIDQMFFHRGIMHSVVFNVALAFALAYILYRSDTTIPYRRYVLGVFVSIVFGHLLIDGMTSYGMRYRLPRSGNTSSTDNVFVVDFGMWIVVMIGLVTSMISKYKATVSNGILAVVACYFAMTFGFQYLADQAFRTHYPENIGDVVAHHTIVEPLQPFLRRHLIKTDTAYYEAYYSILDDQQDIQRESVVSDQTGDQLIAELMSQDNHLATNLKQVQSFARGMTRVVNQSGDYLIQNMMFGPLLGREAGEQERMFNFRLTPVSSGYELAVDQGDRRGSLTKQSRSDFWKRVWGA